MVTFALIWLAYLRTRERRLALEGLAIYVPRGQERSAALRVLCLDPSAARIELFHYDQQDTVTVVEPQDHGNLDTRRSLAAVRRQRTDEWEQVFQLEGVERIPRHDGRVSLRVRGMEFAEIAGSELHLA